MIHIKIFEVLLTIIFLGFGGIILLFVLAEFKENFITFSKQEKLITIIMSLVVVLLLLFHNFDILHWIKSEEVVLVLENKQPSSTQEVITDIKVANPVPKYTIILVCGLTIFCVVGGYILYFK